MKKIVLALGILVIVCVIGLSFVFAEERYVPNYTIKPIISEETIDILNRKTNERTIQGFEITIEGIKLNTCYAHSQYSSTCVILTAFQNEKIIQQNDEIIRLLKEIRNK